MCGRFSVFVSGLSFVSCVVFVSRTNVGIAFENTTFSSRALRTFLVFDFLQSFVALASYVAVVGHDYSR